MKHRYVALWYSLGIMVLAVSSAHAQAGALRLRWQAPVAYTSGAPLELTDVPLTYRFYVGPDVNTLVVSSYELGPTKLGYPSALLSDIGLDPGECVAVVAVDPNGGFSDQSTPYCFAVPSPPPGKLWVEE